MFIMITISLVLFLKKAYPILKSSCETAAASKGNKIINQEINNIMKNYTYDEIINIEKDEYGKINLIKADVIKINEITTQIISNIQKEFDRIPRITVFINMGTVTGISMLNQFDPKFEVELESAGNLKSKVKTEFESVGINQTQHKVFLELEGKVGILTPFGSFSEIINSKVLLLESLIVGEVPETYYNLPGIEQKDDTFNFIE